MVLQFLQVRLVPNITVGDAPTIAQAGETVVLLNGNGFCWNSHSANTRANPAVCDQAPQSIANTLSYIIGTTSQVENFFHRNWDSSLLSGRTITPCDPILLSGVYDNGQLPSASISGGVVLGVGFQLFLSQ